MLFQIQWFLTRVNVFATKESTGYLKFLHYVFAGNRFFQPRKEVTYTMQFWLRIVPNRQRSRLHSKKFQNLNEMLFLNRECSGDLKVNCQGTMFTL